MHVTDFSDNLEYRNTS